MGRSSGGQTLASLAPTKGNTVGGEGSLFGAESVGADGEVLTANAGATRGFDWQPSAGGGGGVTVSHGFQRVPGSQSIDDDTETLIDTYDVGGSTSGTAFTLGLTRITINAAIEVAATANLRFADDSTGFRYIEILHKNVGDVVVNRRRQTSAASTVANQPTATVMKDVADEYTEFSPNFPTRIDGKGVNSRIGEAFSDDPGRTVAAEMANAKVQVYGDVAILSYNYIGLVRDADGNVETSLAKSTRVYVRKDGSWKLVHANFAPVGDDD